MTLYLIRHGKTHANEQHLYCGSTDLPLSEEGLAKLRTAMMRLHATANQPSESNGALFITSGMKRTNETLQALFGDVDYREEPRLREMDFGLFEMRSYEELKDDPLYQAWIAGDNHANLTPGGESGQMMLTRALEALHELDAFSEKDLVIVTHGGVIAAVMQHLFPREDKNRYEWQPACGHGYALENGLYRPLDPREAASLAK